MGKIIGIDFGNANASVAVTEGGKPVIILDHDRKEATPCFIAEGSNRIIGEYAKRMMNTRPGQIARSFQADLGKANAPSSGFPAKAAGDYAEAMLSYLIQSANDYLGEKVSGAVLAVPPTLFQKQRLALADIAGKAGLSYVAFMNDISAVALLNSYAQQEGRFLIYDFGAAHTSISVAETGDGVAEILSAYGRKTICGDLFDYEIANHIARTIYEQYHLKIENNSPEWAQILYWAEDIKKQLSVSAYAYACFPLYCQNGKTYQPVETALSRTEFENMIGKHLQKLGEMTKEALQEAGDTLSNIQQVIIGGGCSAIPCIQHAVEQITGKNIPFRILSRSTTAMGAAVLGGIRAGEIRDQLLLDATSHIIGIKTEGDVVTPLLDKNTTTPASKTQIFSTASDNQSDVDIYILEGDQPVAGQCEVLFHEHISHIPPAPRGVPKIEILISVDYNGLASIQSKLLPPASNSGPAPQSGDSQPKSNGAPPPSRPQNNSSEPTHSDRPQNYNNGINPTVRKMIDDILPTIDNLDQAIRNTRDRSVADGMRNTIRGLLEKIEGWGAEEIPALGMRFDPHCHEALMVVSGDKDDIVTEVIKRGFRMNGRVIRYAQVIVCQRKK